MSNASRSARNGSALFALAINLLLIVPAGRGDSTPVFTSQDVFSLQRAEDTQISHDGKRVAYVRGSADIMTDGTRRSVWGIDLATGEQTPLISGAAWSPRWSPDDRRLAYLATDAHGMTQIFMCQPGSGISGQLTSDTQAPDAPTWSPDGRWIAFQRFVPEEPSTLGSLSLQKPAGATWALAPRVIDAVHYLADGTGYTQRGHTHLFVVSADGGTARQVTSGYG